MLHLAWMREYDETGKFTKEEGEAYRETIKSLLSHYTTPAWKVTSVLDGVARGWSDVVLDLGAGFNCRLQRHSEFETLTLSGPGGWMMKFPRRLNLGVGCCHRIGWRIFPGECF